ncbi:MAG TPA: lipase maturation factor family protein [Candidatus Sulfotelmatobacter sp.]|nr:lipase maturation factor family protein [Candidatus Sulfotelmatobacter sp.]
MSRTLFVIRWLFDPKQGPPDRFLPRWLFLRALGLVYFSAFFSLAFQIHGLIGPQGILPASEYLPAVAHSLGHLRGVWFAPTLLWISSSAHMLTGLCWFGMLASVLLTMNLQPRGTLFVCFICYLSFVSAAQDFSSYQSDGMLLEAGFVSLFFAPSGFRPRWGAAAPPSRASLFLLQWEWFRIYFESGVAKIAGGDIEWRNFTAMDEYYQNGPLPTWIGWYVQHLPHWFHAATVYATLGLELALVWAFLLPRRWRIVCFLIITPWEIGIIFTANYTFLNYLVLILGFLLLDDYSLRQMLPARWKESFLQNVRAAVARASEITRTRSRQILDVSKLAVAGIFLSWIFYAATVELLWMFSTVPFPTSPVAALEPFRIANRYGLFGIMTRGRYEIEFQGSDDGQTWKTYAFRFKPQDLSTAPGIYAPYQPRFDWNLWFASLGSWRDYVIVPRTEICLLNNDPDVLALFASNPFTEHPPREVRAVLWQYWFTTMAEKRSTGRWWRRQLIGLYAPTIERDVDGEVRAVEWPDLTFERRD